MGSGQSAPQRPERPNGKRDGDVNPRARLNICPPPIDRDLTRRAVFEGHGCTIFAYPSTGGVVIKNDADLVDMHFLGLDRFSPCEKRYDDDVQETMFSRQVRKVGGKWWPDMGRYVNVTVGARQPIAEERVERYFGWPNQDAPSENSSEDTKPKETGVFVLEYDVDDPEEIETARLRMAISMAEKVELMKRMGAKFYADPRDYEGLKDAYDRCE
jgi:hypothetical protein